MTKTTFILNLVSERGTINAFELAQECIWAGFGAPVRRHLTRIGVKEVAKQEMKMKYETIQSPVYGL